MIRTSLAASVLAGILLSGTAWAADDGSLTWNGITLYGSYDISVTHQTHSAPVSSDWSNGTYWMISKASYKSITAIAPGAAGPSRVGLRAKEALTDDIDFVGNAELGFNPQSGKLSDGPQSLVNNNGVAANRVKAASDSPLAGQVFSRALNAGLSSKTFGTVTLGRNVTLNADAIGKYDPQGGSLAFSLLGFSGALGGGGATEDSRLDGSLKYTYKYDLFHFGWLYQPTGVDGSPGVGRQYNAGVDWKGLSVDYVHATKKDALALASLSAAQVVTFGRDALAATVSDNTVDTIGASYGVGPWKVSGGYERIKLENPGNPLAAGFSGLGGYWIAVTNNTAFPHAKTLETSWVGVKYAFNKSLDIVGAWYHQAQNAYGATRCSTTAAANCSGDENVFSVRLDYKFNKRFDTYAGLAYSKVSDGLASGFLYRSNVDPTIGLRFQF